MEYVVHLAQIKGVANIALHQCKARLAAQVPQVLSLAGKQVVHREHGVTLGQQGVTEMGAQKAGAPGH